jgi:4-hydroxybenzoate polyprenyltransferase
MPADVPRLLSWAFHGRRYLDRRLAELPNLDVSLLLYDDDHLRKLSSVRDAGRGIVLDAGQTPELGRRVAAHLGLFDEVTAADKGITAKRMVRDAKTTAWNRDHVPALLRAMRPHHWLKNLLLFVPILAAHELDHPAALFDVGLAFAAFCLCASAVYLANDLFDLASDRIHPRKRLRPIASGRAPVVAVVMLVPFLALASLALTLALPAAFGAMLACYLLVNMAYTMRIKQILGLDVIVLALLYALRIGAGAAAAAMTPSYWLLAFSMFLFLSLALLKRFAELRELDVLEDSNLHGRDYRGSDVSALLSLGGASGYISVLVLVLYINGDAITLLYGKPQFIWLLCPLLMFWITRMWLIAQRGELREDPLFFAVCDKPSLMVALASLVTILFAI